jgi:hypothetical protein
VTVTGEEQHQTVRRVELREIVGDKTPHGLACCCTVQEQRRQLDETEPLKQLRDAGCVVHGVGQRWPRWIPVDVDHRDDGTSRLGAHPLLLTRRDIAIHAATTRGLGDTIMLVTTRTSDPCEAPYFSYLARQAWL